MISLFSGTPGSGKTLHAVHVIDWYNRHGKPCVVNFELNRAKIKHPDLIINPDEDNQITPEMLLAYSEYWFQDKPMKEGEILLVLDEAQLIFNARDWQFNRPWISFFTQHRKYGYDVILIAQYDRMLERQVRSLIEYEEKHLKVSNMGGFWGILLSLILGRYRIYKKWYNQSKMLISQERSSYGRREFELYDTYKTW